MDEWFKFSDGTEYKEIGVYGKWVIIKLRYDGAFYSSCPNCGYIHSCYRFTDEIPYHSEYDMEKEFNFCPMCGKHLKRKKDNVKFFD